MRTIENLLSPAAEVRNPSRHPDPMIRTRILGKFNVRKTERYVKEKIEKNRELLGSIP